MKFILLINVNMPTTVGILTFISSINTTWERSGSVEECSTQDRGAAGKSLTSVTALWSLSKHIYPSLVLVQPGVKNQIKQNKQNKYNIRYF